MQGGFQPEPAHAECLTESLPWPTPDASGAEGPPLDRITKLARTLELDVIPRLAAAHRAQAHPQASNDAQRNEITSGEVESFTSLVIGQKEAAIGAFVTTMRSRGLSIEALFIDLFAPSARRFGVLWEEDLCDFSAVTVGLGRLQRLMRELSPAFGTEVAHPPNGRRALLVRAPGEQHSFGLSMVAEFFRRSGWEVQSGGEGAPTDPITAVRREWFDIAGFAAGSEARLDWLPSCIAAVRSASCNRGLRIMVGGPVFTLRPQLAKQVGADATTADGSQAPAVAESLLAGRVRRS
jgi:methanogenic corrinoid protein MtbC1